MRLLLPLALLVAACQPAAETPERVCTMEFRTIGVTVVDSTGAPVASAAVDVIREATGESVVCASEGQEGCVQPAASSGVQGGGNFEVMTDAVPVSEAGETFRVVARHDGLEAEAPFQIGFDGCHVEKLSGPDTLRLGR